MTSLDYIREHRVMRVEIDGRLGIVTSANSSGNINVRFDESKYAVNCHPLWNTRYFDKEGNTVADYRKDTNIILKSTIKSIQDFLNKNGYSYSVADILKEYKESYKRYYLSFTMKHCCSSLTAELDVLVKANY